MQQNGSTYAGSIGIFVHVDCTQENIYTAEAASTCIHLISHPSVAAVSLALLYKAYRRQCARAIGGRNISFGIIARFLLSLPNATLALQFGPCVYVCNCDERSLALYLNVWPSTAVYLYVRETIFLLD